jgi:hypothetical protein
VRGAVWGRDSPSLQLLCLCSLLQPACCLRQSALTPASVPGLSCPQADPSWLSRVTAAWQRGRMSNLHYLLFLNLASGRTLSDLSQVGAQWCLAVSQKQRRREGLPPETCCVPSQEQLCLPTMC